MWSIYYRCWIILSRILLRNIRGILLQCKQIFKWDWRGNTLQCYFKSSNCMKRNCLEILIIIIICVYGPLGSRNAPHHVRMDFRCYFSWVRGRPGPQNLNALYDRFIYIYRIWVPGCHLVTGELVTTWGIVIYCFSLHES